MLNYYYLFIFVLCSYSLSAQISFQEITESLGRFSTGDKNHGIALADFDNDGDEDIYAFTRLNENKLYENLGNGQFNNVAALAGINATANTRAAVWGDFNNDGWLDLYLGVYQAADRLFLNNGAINNGDVTFTDITFSAGINNLSETSSVQLADIDNDGWLDIYVANFLAENHLYKNNGDLTFTNYTVAAGVSDASYSMGCAFFDYDRDGDQDLYLVHDFAVANILYQNDGTGHFTNVAAAAQLDLRGHGMGVDVADVNRDGWLDLYVTDLDKNVLLLNNQNGTFRDISTAAGIEDEGMGWSTFFMDANNDGWQDIYVVNDSQFSPEPNVLYENQQDNTFKIACAAESVSSTGDGVGGACADLNNDGLLDIVIANTFSANGNQVFKNVSNPRNWIGLKLKGTAVNRSAIGAIVDVEYGNEQQTDVIMAGTGFASANTLQLHFGLADHTKIDRATVHWGDGTVEIFTDLAANQVHQITQMRSPIISNASMTDTLVEQYGKFECRVDVAAAFENPYNYDEIAVTALFTSPTGAQQTVDGFFMQEYDMNTANGVLTTVGEGTFKVRFAPHEIGTWRVEISATDSLGTSTYDEQTFECTDITTAENNGFVRTGATNYLEFDNAEQLILIGENMAWENTNPFTNYRNWLTKLDNNGGNFIRLWHAHWGLGIEWEDGWGGFSGLGKYHQPNSFYQDWLFDYCAERGIYVMLALQHHGPVSSNVNPNWNESPYNKDNGGMCENTWDFFTDQDAKDFTKNRYRYIVARWGYARSVQSWELFNEVNWTDNFTTHQTKIQDWHMEMAAYLKEIDPYQHLVTTSFAHADEDPVVWNNPDIDFTQTHYYINTSNIERALAGGVQDYLTDFDKPTLTGEFGLGGTPNLSNADGEGIHFHNAMWGALFAGGMGTAMTWWWDVYVHPRDLYHHFAPLRSLTDAIPFVEKDLKPTTAYVTGAPGDLVLTPSLGWAAEGDEEVIINNNGTTQPANPALGQYLYGSQWNTEYRSPPSFTVNYPEEGIFTVTTNNEKGSGSKVSIYLNGNLVLNENAQINTDYTIIVPAGNNLIKVDNLGNDWVAISAYNFSGVGSQINAYALSGTEQNVAAGWVLNHEYNHVEIAANGAPVPVDNAELVVQNFQEGDYIVKWFDCLTGDIVAVENVTNVNGQLTLPIPTLYWDLAFVVDDQPAVVSTNELWVAEELNIYPNPAKAGQEIAVTFNEQSLAGETIAIYNVSGQLLHTTTLQGKSFQIPPQFASGFYWLNIQGKQRIRMRGIVID